MRIGVNALSVVPRETGGGETYLRELLEALADLPRAAAHDIAVVCSANAAALFPERGPVRRVVVPLDNRARLRRLRFEHLQLDTLLRRERVDVLFAPGNALPWRLSVPAVLGVQSLHSFVVPEEMSKARVAYFRRAVPRSARRATRILCVSEDLRRLLLRVVSDLDPSHVRVVHEGAPADVARVTDTARVADACRARGVEPGRFVLFVSSLNPFKRPERAVEALAWWRGRSGETWPLLLVGRASEVHTQRVRAAAAACGYAESTLVAGTASRGELAALLSGARVMVYPSTVETFGLPPLEAMACGCPVVAADRTSIPEIVGDAALLVDPDDVPAFGAALGRALHDEALRAALVTRGTARLAQFRWDAAADATLALLEEAAATRRG